MSTRFVPYINFAGEARSAMTFYHEVFGGDLQISTYGDSGMAENPDDADKIMHSELTAPGGFSLMASDAPAGMPLDDGARISIAHVGESSDAEAMARAFVALAADGGSVVVPFEKAPWGDIFGLCTDRFGVSWMFDADGGAAFPS